MPDTARKDSPSGPIVNIHDCTIADKDNHFYCSTAGCPAVMSIVSFGTPDAYFRRLPSSPKHISVDCVRCALIFDPSKYDETKFNKNSAFNWMFTPPKSTRGTTGTKKGHVGGSAHNSLRTLGNIYKMCVTKSKSDTYNRYKINDMFADAENYSYYKTNLNGNIIVECSFFKKVYNEPALLFNYPTDYKKDHVILRLNFENEQLCWDYYNKLKTTSHTEPIAIAGNLEPVKGNPDYQCQANFFSTRQIYVVR